MRATVAAMTVLCASCGTVGNDELGPPVDVATVIARRGELYEQRVVLEGFLSRDGEFYFVRAGERRPQDRFGAQGERFWCTSVGFEPRRLWFAATEVRHRRLGVVDDISRGRLAIVTGVLDNVTPLTNPSDVGLFNVEARDLADTAVGPLRDVEIVELLDEYCLGGRS